MRFIVAVILLLLGAGGAHPADVQRTLALSGLTCAACSAAVTKALKQVEGVRTVSVSEDQRQAVVLVDEAVAPGALVSAVARAGFAATVAAK